MKVNLFIAGACKSGTSFLHDFLSQQNDICGSNPKEPYYFELPENRRNELENRSKYFHHYQGEKYVLDGRHRTMFFKWIPQAIHDYNPNSKIIFILRNPIDRAFSHWWMWYSRKVITKGFHRVISTELREIASGRNKMDWQPEEYLEYVQTNVPQKRMAYADFETIVASGLYYEQIKRFQKFFDDRQILILDFEELKDETSLIPKISKFLEVEILQSKINSAVRNEAAQFQKINHPFSKLVPKAIKSYVKKLFFSKPRVQEKTKRVLMDYYKDDILGLVHEFEIDFPKKWL